LEARPTPCSEVDNQAPPPLPRSRPPIAHALHVRCELVVRGPLLPECPGGTSASHEAEWNKDCSEVLRKPDSYYSEVRNSPV